MAQAASRLVKSQKMRKKVHVHLLQVPLLHSDYHPHHALMAKTDRQPQPCMFSANIAFKETPSFKAPEDGPDISKEHSLKGGVFIVMSIESDNKNSHLLSSPYCLTSV